MMPSQALKKQQQAQQQQQDQQQQQAGGASASGRGPAKAWLPESLQHATSAVAFTGDHPGVAIMACFAEAWGAAP
jgi:type II secretory pathway pseudopilin PulG